LQRQAGTDNRQKAMQCFEKAVQIDPKYSAPSGALAVARARDSFHRSGDPAEDARQARTYALRALAADERNQEAELALAMIAYWHEWNWAEAESHYRRAMEIAPSYATAHNNYALALTTRGHTVEAIAEARKALDLDPLSFAVSNDLAVALYTARRFDESRERADRVLSIKPDFFVAHLIKGSALYCEHKYPEAIEEYRKVIEAGGKAEAVLGRLGAAYALAGRRQEALDVLRTMDAIAPADRNWIYRAMLETGLGDLDQTFAALDKAAAARETDVLFLDADAIWDPLRGDPRFQALRKRIGLD